MFYHETEPVGCLEIFVHFPGERKGKRAVVCLYGNEFKQQKFNGYRNVNASVCRDQCRFFKNKKIKNNTIVL